jgi:hypothetical protein
MHDYERNSLTEASWKNPDITYRDGTEYSEKAVYSEKTEYSEKQNAMFTKPNMRDVGA